MIDSSQDYALPEEWIDRRMPWDDLEHEDKPADLVRDARLKTIELLNGFASGIERAISRPDATVRDVASAFWGPAYGMGLNCCEGVSMTERSEALNLERATISKNAIRFCAAYDLPPSWYMKEAGSGAAYSAARVEVVKRGKAKPFKIPPPLPNEAIE